MLLMRQMESDGQKTPIAVYKSTARGDRKQFTLIYGARRLWAAQKLGWPTINALLRTKDEASSLAIADNLSQSELNALEAAEHFSAYREWWEATFGKIEPGRRKKSGQDGRINADLDLSKKPSFYKDLLDKFGISEREGRRRYSIRLLEKSLRDAIRGTDYADDQTRLIKLAKLGPEKQNRIAAKLRENPDLEAVLREPDPETGREPTGRMETGDWREKQFRDAWEAMPRDRRAAALEKIGAMPKPIDVMPHLSVTVGVRSPRNRSKLWAAIADPMALREHISVEDQRLWKQAETTRQLHYTLNAINNMERSLKVSHKAEVAKENAKRSRKSKPGPKPRSPEEKRVTKKIKALEKSGVLKELATLLLVRYRAEGWIVRNIHRLDEDQQRYVISELQRDEDLDRIAWEVAKMLDEIDEVYGSEIDFEAASKPIGGFL
ncbi:ParB-like nuclease domain-containing protein [Rhizobium sp. RU35A]|nr:ParB-like nuclease domain-containing protein [Rhizobium sp. RU35A]